MVKKNFLGACLYFLNFRVLFNSREKNPFFWRSKLKRLICHKAIQIKALRLQGKGKGKSMWVLMFHNCLLNNLRRKKSIIKTFFLQKGICKNIYYCCLNFLTFFHFCFSLSLSLPLFYLLVYKFFWVSHWINPWSRAQLFIIKMIPDHQLAENFILFFGL